MHLKHQKYLCCIAIFVSLVLVSTPGLSAPAMGFKTAVIVSKKIRPYLQVVEGVSDGAANEPIQMDVFFLSDQDKFLDDPLIIQLQTGRYDLVTALGPEAAILVWGSRISSKKMHAAVLDPDALPGFDPGACGISLRIPVGVQLENITQRFYTLKRIGLLFDPLHNQWFFEQAHAAALDHGLELIPLKVSSRNQIAGVFNEFKNKIDAIWMIPDETVISEKIIHYVIKQGLYNNLGVIGYNSFFTRSGAFFSFEFDYRSLGVQIGKKMATYLQTDQCSKDAPVFKTMINQKMADRIGIQVKP